MSGQLSMDSNPIFGLPTPVVGSHAATKTYVDGLNRMQLTSIMSSGVTVSDATTIPSSNITLSSATTNFNALRLEIKTSSGATDSQYCDITSTATTATTIISYNYGLTDTLDIMRKFKLHWETSTTMTAYYGRAIIYGTYSNTSNALIYIANIWGINY